MSQTKNEYLQQAISNVIKDLEDIRAEMILANLDAQAESLLTVVNDLIWQYRELEIDSKT